MWWLLNLPKQELISQAAPDGAQRELSAPSLFYKQGRGRMAGWKGLAQSPEVTTSLSLQSGASIAEQG